MRLVLTFTALLTFAAAAHAQWDILDGHTTADLRGVDNAGGGVVWASGTNGTVLRSEDAGIVWQLCAVPPGAEKLDFRGIQALDANTAIVMSSGKGELSRLYTTSDGCQTWTLLFTNPDADGFFDSLRLSNPAKRTSRHSLVLLGDPVKGRLKVWSVADPFSANAKKRRLAPAGGYKVNPHEASFAASNSVILGGGQGYDVATGGEDGARILSVDNTPGTADGGGPSFAWKDVPVGNDTASSGIFSFGYRADHHIGFKTFGVAVGGDYLHPNDSQRTAAYRHNGYNAWWASTTLPHGYRSSVEYDDGSGAWIAVGPNGTDVSTDDGENWRALRPKAGEPGDADQHWNALSLPYVVGPHGRIGKLRTDALPRRNSK